MKTCRLLLLLLLMCSMNTRVSAQWAALPLLITGTDTATSVSMIKSFGGKLFVCTDKGLFTSYDDGDSWISLTYNKAVTGGKNILSFYYDYDADKLYAGGDSAVYASTDNGASWFLTAIKSIDKANDISKAGFNIVVSHGVPGYPSGGVYWSDDNMITAKIAVAPVSPAFGFLTDGALAFMAGKDGAYVSEDMGATWNISGSGHPDGARYFRMTRHHGSIYAADINGHGLIRSNDEGNIWYAANSTVFKNFCQVFDVAANNDIIIAVTEGACNDEDPVKASTDTGKTWHPLMYGLPPGYFTRLGINSTATCFYVFNQNDGILYRNCAPLSIAAVPDPAPLLKLYPNPVTDVLHVDGMRSAAVSICDALGKRLYYHEFDNQEILLDLHSFSPGNYFVTITQGDTRITRTVSRQ